MEHDERDRRDPTHGDRDPSLEPPASPDADPPLTPADATSTWPSSDRFGDVAPVEPPPASTYETAATESGPAPSEIESWPSQSSAAAPGSSWDDATTASDEWHTSPPSRAEPADAAWPTEPPAAGSSAEDAWPTAAPERGAEPILEPAWGDERPTEPVEAPPPSEIEAYPTAAADDAVVAPPPAAIPAHAVPDAAPVAGEGTQCPRCGTENRPGLAFCRNCGQRLVAAGVATTVERPSAPEGSTACPRCGTHNRAGVAFCQNCGANLRGTGPGYVPPAIAEEAAAAPVAVERRGAVLGPIVLLIGVIGLITGYLLPFLFGSDSLFERAWGESGYGVAFWNGYPDVGAGLAEQAYFGLAGPVPLLVLLLLGLAVAGFIRAVPGLIQTIGLFVALLWSAGLAILFVVVELAANWDGDIVGLLRVLTPAGIIFFLSALIVLIGTLTRLARS